MKEEQLLNKYNTLNKGREKTKLERKNTEFEKMRALVLHVILDIP